MLRLSKMADYGLIVLTHVARAPVGHIHTARSLAREAKLPEPTVSKVVKALSRAGVLHGHRGARGGYSLARSAEKITMAEVVVAVDGPVAMTPCLNHNEGCALAPDCPARPGWARLNAVMTAALAKTTLADMGVAPEPDSEYRGAQQSCT